MKEITKLISLFCMSVTGHLLDTGCYHLQKQSGKTVMKRLKVWGQNAHEEDDCDPAGGFLRSCDDMKRKEFKNDEQGNEKTAAVICLLAAACILAAGGYFIGKNAGEKPVREAQEQLYALNRASIERIDIGEGPVYVIGHRSPDSDTVCSAIAYARLLTMLGYPANAAVTAPVNRETAYILKAAGADTPPVLEDASGKNIFLVDHSEYSQAAEGMADAHEGSAAGRIQDKTGGPALRAGQYQGGRRENGLRRSLRRIVPGVF